MSISTPRTADDIPARTAYRDWAAVYDSNDNKTRDLDAACLIAADLPLAGAIVVEFGAGTGKNTAHLARHAAGVIAMDLSPDMLARARERGLGAHVRFIEHDITREWPVEPGTADVVVGNLVLEHVRELGPVMAQAARTLRPGARLYLSELHPFRQLRGSQARFDRADGSEAMVEAYYHGVSDYLAAAQAAGLSLRKLEEPVEDGTAISAGTPPRLLVLQFVKTT
ncbi:class I SAM-dependent methyltransferase [Maricaulis maris]|uniref:Malonyl-CoA O-methyltransferase n=1 Tax=Maricaulis maris TaxID=74318 RepID=A0A495DCZ6_9PROT|nr:class I SAM-dependent methyltransferase [Maricaulis maris]RKR00162.1 malonyl-CoA O-methyltransferase [Maricaulis maris]